MTEKKCPIHKIELDEVLITKGEGRRVIGTNYFCTKMNCKYEVDDYGTRNTAS